MPILRGCCCFDLKTGAKIIGIVALILEVLNFVATVLFLIVCTVLQDVIIELLEEIRNEAASAESKNTLFDRNPERDFNFNLEGDYGQGYSEISSKEVEETINWIINNFYQIKIFFLCVLGLQLLDIICSSCLIHGIRKNRRGLVLPFVILHVLFVMIDLGILVLIITAYAYYGVFHGIFLSIIVLGIIWLTVHIYLLLVVISEHQALGLILMHSNDEMCLK